MKINHSIKLTGNMLNHLFSQLKGCENDDCSDCHPTSLNNFLKSFPQTLDIIIEVDEYYRVTNIELVEEKPMQIGFVKAKQFDKAAFAMIESYRAGKLSK